MFLNRIFKYIIFSAVQLISFASVAQLPCGQNIDFNTWSQEGYSSSGAWNVTNGGNTVEQNINGESTWFVSPNDFFNVLIQGTIQVNTNADDDLVGFVFGYQDPFGPLLNPTNTNVKSFVFDWKQESQTFVGMPSNEGFALYEVDGLFDFTNVVVQGSGSVHPMFWERINTPILTVLDTDYGNNGWNDFQQYDFQLKYTADSIVIWIDNQVIFQESGCFEPGRFGFYNHSQDQVIYSNFSYDFEYDFVVSDTLICAGDSVDMTIGSGCLNYFSPSTSFDWDFGDNTFTSGIDPNHTYTTSGNYDIQLIVSDPIGCADTSYKSVQVLEYPVSSAGVDDVSCGLTYALSASSSSGSWTGSAGVVFSDPNLPNSSVTVSTAGNYEFYWEATNAAGCHDVDTVQVEFTQITLSASLTEPACSNANDGEISVSVQGGTAPYSYQWGGTSNNQITNQATNLFSGLHNVTVTDANGCTADSTFVLDSPPPFSFSLSTVATDCDLNTGSASITNVSGGTPGYLYDWGFGSTPDSSFQGLSSGNYSVIISDVNGCDTTVDFTIQLNPFVASIVSISDISCYGANDGQAIVSGPNNQTTYSYQWSASAGGQTTATATNLSPGQHSVVVSTSSGCTDTLTIVISEPDALIISQISNFSVCDGDTVTLNATISGGTAPYTYNWGNGIGAQQAPEIVVVQTDQFPLQVTDANGCIALDTAYVDVLGSPTASFTVDTTETCLLPGHEFIFINTSTPQGLTATWDFGDQTAAVGDTVSHIYSTSGAFSVTISVSNATGCMDSFTDTNLIQIYPNPIANFGYTPDQLTVLNSTAQFIDLSEGTVQNWEWEFGNLGGSNLQNPNFDFPQVNGEFDVLLIVEDENGCIDSITQQLTVFEDVSIYAPNTFTPNGDEFNNVWQVYANGVDLNNFEITIYNRWGQKIWQSFDINIPWDGTYLGKMVQDGVYTWKIKTKSPFNDDKYEFIGHINVIR